jgi:FHS family glucose/mannose:H+ symporter-like MFS transporter
VTVHAVSTRESDVVVLSRAALTGVAATFFLMGTIAAAYGPLLEHLTQRFQISLSFAGATLSVHFAGALVGVLGFMWSMDRISGRAAVGAALACMGAGCAGVALAPTWATFLGAVFLIGLGFGALDIGLNQLVAHSAGPRRTAVLNALNGAYGVGAVAGPVLISTLAASHLALLYAGGAAAALALVPAAAGISGRLPVAPRVAGGAGTGALVGIFVCAFALYVGVETGTGGWMTSHLESLGLASLQAATLTSGFWMALAAGRLLVPLVPDRVPEAAIVLTGAAVATLSLLAATIGAVAPFAYILTGLAIAPIFPTGIVWLAKIKPGDARATSWLFPASMVGGIVVPGAIGLVIARFGIALAPAVVSVVAAATLATFWLARRRAAAPF